MINVRVDTSQAAAVAQAMRDVPARILPYATATALTRTALAAREAIRAEMSAAFDRPTPYTLNSLFVRPANVRALTARVNVKDQTTNGGTLPQDYLLPEVEGGERKEKRFERALRYGGLLPSGWRAILTRGAAPLLDAYGNLPRGTTQSILAALKAQAPERLAKRSKSARKAPYFAVTPSQAKGHLKPGVWARKAAERKIYPVLLFTSKPPRYHVRLDFDGIAARTASERFEPELRRAVTDMLGRSSG